MFSRRNIARMLSLVGHPVFVVPAAVAYSTQSARITGVLILCAVVLTLYAIIQVRRGKFSNLDISDRAERPGFLRVSVVAIIVFALVHVWVTGEEFSVISGYAAGLFVVLAAILLNRWLKPSLHVGMDVLAVGIVALKSIAAAIPFLLLTMGVAWSRLALERHTRHELLVGTLLGVLGSLAFVLPNFF